MGTGQETNIKWRQHLKGLTTNPNDGTLEILADATCRLPASWERGGARGAGQAARWR